jgi:TPR repeat protein
VPAAPFPADDRLTARADLLFRSGDVSGARLLLERAQGAGNAQAIFLLAETFDPNALAAIGAVGIRSDPARARELYGRALALGITAASARLDALK